MGVTKLRCLGGFPRGVYSTDRIAPWEGKEGEVCMVLLLCAENGLWVGKLCVVFCRAAYCTANVGGVISNHGWMVFSPQMYDWSVSSLTYRRYILPYLFL